ncbi:MAG: hypothetical protein KDC34_17485 [Saprospiraceae bacterium]|nr:hypothetical protein [Saprospiraceae bacterium]
MNNIKYLFGIGAILSLFFFACADTDNQAVQQASLNPNGDSELALLMRAMFLDGMQVKEALKKGEKPEISVEFEKIHSAKATEPEKAASDTYHAFALAYEQSVLALQDAAADAAPVYYDQMVSACMNCHKAICPGPTMRIQQLEWKRE